MKKDLQRLVLATIVGSLAVMTGCGKNDNAVMKNGQRNGKVNGKEQKQGRYQNGQDSMYKGDRESKPSDGEHDSCQ